MGDLAVRVHGLGKEYRLGAYDETNSFREAFVRMATGPIRRAHNLLRGEAYGAAELSETVWALKDISFEVKKGEVVGIIGHNGAGKSTLLKVLSRITEPSKGYVDVWGRVGSLLEVGTGFHQELTGRENIYLNGAILGMRNHEIDKKFDEIVDFSGVAKFIDTPVKHYSSGMRLRLGFAVAAHLEPEILVVDEVLAVGDAAFQKKCLGKMQDVANEGRTVLFVSHNMDAIVSLTKRCILLKAGCIIADSDSDTVVKDYLEELEADSDEIVDLTPEDASGQQFYFSSARINNVNGHPSKIFIEGEPMTIELECVLNENINSLELGIAINQSIYSRTLFTIPYQFHAEQLNKGTIKLRMQLEPNYLTSGTYSLVLKGVVNGVMNMVEALNFRVVNGMESEWYHTKKWVAGPVRLDYGVQVVERAASVLSANNGIDN